MVTGAGRGLGAAVARAMAARGARVVLVARTQAEVAAVAREIGHPALPVAADVADVDAVGRAFALARAAFGPCDCLIGNAATLGPVAPMWETDAAAWAATQRVNVDGAYHCLRAALRDMVGAGAGTVLGITSGAAYGGATWHSAYSTSKAAFEQLHRAAHAEVDARTIRIALFDPGGVDTAMMSEVRGQDFPGVDEFRRLHAAGRLRPAERVAGVVAGVIAGGVLAGHRYHVDELDAAWTEEMPSPRAGLPG